MAASLADFETLKWQLEDTEGSLAAALARIEAFRIHEKMLCQELAQLRLGRQPAQEQQQQAGTDGAASSMQHQSNAQQLNALGGGTQACQQSNVPAVTQARAPSGNTAPMPAYITDISGHVPVMIVSGGRKVPGSIVVTPDYIDFVEVRARIKADDFVGFTTAPTLSPSKRQAHMNSPRSGDGSPAWKQLLPSCLNPVPLAPDELELPAKTRGGPASTSTPIGSSSSAPGSPSRSHARRNSWGTSARGSPRGSPRAAGSGWHPTPEPAFTRLDSGGTSAPGVWQILWRSGEMPQQLTFEATRETREMLHRHTAKWLGEDTGLDHEPQTSGAGGADGDAIEIVMPRHLTLSPSIAHQLGNVSTIINGQLAAMLDSGLPSRYQGKQWSLAYSTQRHGISLQTLHRRAVGAARSILLVKDSGGYVFGAFTAEAWRVSPRFYGTGETFVFQLEPHRIMYPWKVKSRTKNDFFQFSTPECLAVGGLGHFAIWLDAELLAGNSGTCGTFGSPCLSCKEEFTVQGVELWSIQ